MRLHRLVRVVQVVFVAAALLAAPAVLGQERGHRRWHWDRHGVPEFDPAAAGAAAALLAGGGLLIARRRRKS